MRAAGAARGSLLRELRRWRGRLLCCARGRTSRAPRTRAHVHSSIALARRKLGRSRGAQRRQRHRDTTPAHCSGGFGSWGGGGPLYARGPRVAALRSLAPGGRLVHHLPLHSMQQNCKCTRSLQILVVVTFCLMITRVVVTGRVSCLHRRAEYAAWAASRRRRDRWSSQWHTKSHHHSSYFCYTLVLHEYTEYDTKNINDTLIRLLYFHLQLLLSSYPWISIWHMAFLLDSHALLLTASPSPHSLWTLKNQSEVCTTNTVLILVCSRICYPSLHHYHWEIVCLITFAVFTSIL